MVREKSRPLKPPLISKHVLILTVDESDNPHQRSCDGMGILVMMYS